MKSLFKSLPSAVVAVSMAATSMVGMTTSAASATTVQDFLAETDAQREARCARKKPHKAKYQMGQRFYRKFEKTEDMVAEKRYADADRVLQGLLADTKTNPYERTVVWQAYANIAFEQSDNVGAIKAIENILSFDDALREKQRVQMMLNLAQLYYSEDRAPEALDILARWEPMAYEACALVSAGQIAFLAQVHYGQENYDKAIKYIYTAIEKAELDPAIEPRENWYGVAFASHWSREEYAEARDILEILVFTYPKRSYWLQMTQAYIELGDDDTAYAILTSLYQSGMLDDSPSQLINVAQIFLGEDTPILAAWLLEAADEAGQLNEKNEDTNMALLGGSYLNAREQAKALPYMIRAAEADGKARSWFTIGQIQFGLDRINEALEAWNTALDAVDGRDEQARKLRYSINMQRGNALTALERFREARQALDAATRDARTDRERRAVQGWRRYVGNEEARVKMLTGR